MELKVLARGAPAVSAKGTGCAASSCGEDRLSQLPAEIRVQIRDHPCYSEAAHHHYARMHVAVAPACNIQCHYCNRKYDCANESRPGVVSEVLSPDQAVRKVLAVAAAIPQLSVLGIAGPGDPLANPERTFVTFRKLSQQALDLKLCLSTNGLMLPELIDALCEHRVGHVTITINCIDPEVGAKIYPWIRWKKRRIEGAEGAAILIEQQQKGLEMLVERGIPVKINSVVIPGVNDVHLREVSKYVKAKGAFLHNLMPLIAEARHGTFFGVTGQRGPTQEELRVLRDACACRGPARRGPVRGIHPGGDRADARRRFAERVAPGVPDDRARRRPAGGVLKMSEPAAAVEPAARIYGTLMARAAGAGNDHALACMIASSHMGGGVPCRLGSGCHLPPFSA